MSIESAFLVKPQLEQHQLFIEALIELQQHGDSVDFLEKSLNASALSDKKYFVRYLQLLNDEAAGINLKQNRVAHTIYWLMDQDDQGELIWLGRVDIRHQLTPYLKKIGGHIGYVIRPTARRQGYGSLILKLALAKVRQGQPSIDTPNALVTCDEGNLASQKIIEKNGGIYINTVKQKLPLPKKRRYWLPLS